MNIADIIIVLILGYGLLSGMYRGFIASGLGLLGFVAAWFGSLFSYKTLMNAALSNATIMGFCSNLLEPESFFQGSDAALLVSDISNTAVFERIGAYISKSVPLVGDTFIKNVNSQAFLGKLYGTSQLSTLADYLDQTVWTAIFGVISFIIMFALIYIVVSLVVNLINHVIEFPVLKGIDWLIGGVFGFMRAAVVVMLLFVVADYVITLFIGPDSAIYKIIEESKLLGFTRSLSFLNVPGMLSRIIGS